MSPTVLFQPQNHVGLGHLNRLSAVALALRRIDSSLRTPFVIEGAAHVLLDALGLPYVPLPSSHLMHETENWSLWDAEARQQLSTEISSAILRTLRPEIVVFDIFPNQAFASVVLAAKLPVVLCLRQVNDLERYLLRLTHLLPYVHRILIPHDEGAFQVPREIRDKSFFVGEIVRPLLPAVAKSHPDCSTIVIHGGGGGYPGTVDFFNASIRAVALLRGTQSKLKVRLITGPLFTDWLELQLAPDVSVIPFDPHLSKTLAEADLVICQAGYNAIAELKRIAVRVLVVPAERRWDNQFGRAEQAAKACEHFRVAQNMNPDELARTAEEFLREPIPLLNSNPAKGARTAAERICEML
jgi:predicted glycosyltransferase